MNGNKEENLRYFISKELRNIAKNEGSLCTRKKRQSRPTLNSSYINDLENSFPREPEDDGMSVILKGENGQVIPGEIEGSDDESKRKKRLSETSRKDYFKIYEEGDADEEARELRELEELEKLEAKRFVDGEAVNPGVGIVVEKITAEEFPANLPGKIDRLLQDNFKKYSENNLLRRERRNKKLKKSKKVLEDFLK